MMKARFWILALFLACLVLPRAVLAQAYPNKPIRIFVPFAPGSSSDVVTRIIGERLQASMGQPVIVENRAGAGGAIAAEAVARAPADGYTLLTGLSASQIVNPLLMKKPTYDGMADFDPVAQVGVGTFFVVVHPSMPIHTLPELVAYIKAQPRGSVVYGSWGAGSGGHIVGEFIKNHAGLEMEHMPYKGSAPVVADLVAGHLKIGVTDAAASLPQIRAGKLRAIAATGSRRSPRLPNMPTVAEQGIPYTTDAWTGIFAPRGTPAAIVDKLYAEVQKVLRDPSLGERFQELGYTVTAASPSDFRQIVAKDTATMKEVIGKANIRLD
jgi:tripartite-type tricarboxylate transporter receptor subunit TctC